MLDYIIIGQGIAGSLLSFELLKRGKKILVLADDQRPSSSSVAGGMYNPVTGKHLAKTWMADELYPFLATYYKELSKTLDSDFYHPTPIYRPYVNENQKSQFVNTIGKHDIANYVEHILPPAGYDNYIKNDLGGIMTRQSGWIDVPKLTAKIKEVLIKSQSFESSVFSHNQLVQGDQYVTYNEHKSKRIIFCEGYYAQYNPLFSWLPFNPVKGETLLTKIENYPIKEIINQNSWIMPLGQSMYRFGATYSWHELDFIPTTKGRETLVEKVEKYLISEYKIINQQAGVRPATKDRRPVFGKHPAFENNLIFNGLGTKGVSIAPYFVDLFCNFLDDKKELHDETTIERFYALY